MAQGHLVEFLSQYVASPITTTLFHISVASSLIIPSVGEVWPMAKSKQLRSKSQRQTHFLGELGFAAKSMPQS